MAEEEVIKLTKQGTRPNGPFDDANIAAIALETTRIRYQIYGLKWWIEEVKKIKAKE